MGGRTLQGLPSGPRMTPGVAFLGVDGSAMADGGLGTLKHQYWQHHDPIRAVLVLAVAMYSQAQRPMQRIDRALKLIHSPLPLLSRQRREVTLSESS
jgi:hypothetical protein